MAGRKKMPLRHWALFIMIIIIFSSAVALTEARLLIRQEAPPQPANTPPAKQVPPDYSELRQKLLGYMDQHGGKYGLYLLDLKSGGEMGINSSEPMAAASSIKIPIVLYLYTLAAEGKINLNDRMAYNQELDWEAGAGAIQYFSTDGAKYRYRTLANFTITLSDNISTRMLKRKLGQENLNGFMASIGGRTVYPSGKNISTARDLAAYMVAVLDFARNYPELGEMFLDDLSNTIWDKDGIPEKIPDEVAVAHKVGSLPGVADDVAAVFLPHRPYILAVMTEGVGENEEDGFQAVSEISRIIYEYQAKLEGAP